MIKFAQTMEMLSWFLVGLFTSMFLTYLAQFYGWTTKAIVYLYLTAFPVCTWLIHNRKTRHLGIAIVVSKVVGSLTAWLM